MDSKNGDILWKNNIGGTKKLVFLREYLLCIFDRKILFLNKLSGEIIKTQTLKNRVLFDSTISKADELLYYETQDDNYIRKIIAINLQTGKTVWKNPIENIFKKQNKRLFSALYSYKKMGNRLFIGADIGFLILDPFNGEFLKWYDSKSNCAFLYKPDSDKSGNIYTASSYFMLYQFITNLSLAPTSKNYDKFSLFKFDQNMKKVWEREISPSVSSPLIAGNKLFIITLNKNDCCKPPISGLRRPVLNCYDKDTGKKLWDFKFKKGNSYFEYIEERNKLYFYKKVVIYCHSYDGIHIFDAENGRLLKKIDLGHHNILSNATLYTDIFPPYCSTFSGGVIYLFGIFNDPESNNCSTQKSEQILSAYKITFKDENNKNP